MQTIPVITSRARTEGLVLKAPAPWGWVRPVSETVENSFRVERAKRWLGRCQIGNLA